MDEIYKIQSYYRERFNLSKGKKYLVGKTQNGEEISDSQLSIIVRNCLLLLNLNKKDDLLDLGCGTAALTEPLSYEARSVLGVDLVPEFVEECKKANKDLNFNFICDDGLKNIDIYIKNKVLLYEVLQHVPYGKFRMFLKNIPKDRPVKVLAGGVPDLERVFNFYNSKNRRDIYYDILEGKKENTIGTWWYREQIEKISSEEGFQCQIYDQPSELYTSHYRFDAVITNEISF